MRKKRSHQIKLDIIFWAQERKTYSYPRAKINWNFEPSIFHPLIPRSPLSVPDPRCSVGVDGMHLLRDLHGVHVLGDPLHARAQQLPHHRHRGRGELLDE